MTVVSNSSPLIILAKLECFDLLNRLIPRLYISAEVQHEVVVSGAGLPGASEVAKAEWIEAKPLPNPAGLLALLDDYHARKLAKAEGLQVRGTVGLLETFCLRAHLPDLRATFQQLLRHSYIDQQLLDLRLRTLRLPPLWAGGWLAVLWT